MFQIRLKSLPAASGPDTDTFTVMIEEYYVICRTILYHIQNNIIPYTKNIKSNTKKNYHIQSNII